VLELEVFLVEVVVVVELEEQLVVALVQRGRAMPVEVRLATYVGHKEEVVVHLL